MHKHIDQFGLPTPFDNPDAITNGASEAIPVRLAYAGEAGQRNNYRGDGYFDIDSSLSKTWTLYHENSLSFAWDVFNSTNSVRFDTNHIALRRITDASAPWANTTRRRSTCRASCNSRLRYASNANHSHASAASAYRRGRPSFETTSFLECP